ncbi:MAG TPA: septum formation initiator family protein [Polyangiaceae bacterium LLY-WYZ-15_(1-7)]|nr:septum formation initiator family protein [Polyangiaceae bacterium LLY-WYZ-15_(1-7)]HJL06552.1 septum formation initiator family protein [Polyangiaceae bacterium LLY-WYZ-15_(1-7)]HJL13766.1 septum formation initiator family protein [Polyangiaceae bacterium LLY-WYZ-15_(1-7)]HJL25291.1 septum formation initiator family protein [Polyangiaceae bacterium LLY-WYZ-15_(1-7)]HJL35593.1 septum formation initiator family protein [Polyangiaceae bacterium LLY-WYZ-15_(1-7)]
MPGDAREREPSAARGSLRPRGRARSAAPEPEGELRTAAHTLAWLLPFMLLVVAIVAVPLRILDEQGLPRYRVLSDELREVDATNQRLEREVRALQREVEALESDPAAIERVARDELGMIRDDELVFQFPE